MAKLSPSNLFYGMRVKLTDEQEYYVNSVIEKNVVFSDSEAGTGKTTLGIMALHYLWEEGEIDRVYYVFSPIQEDKMGFRPGTQEEKERAYADPVMTAIKKLGYQTLEQATNPATGFLTITSHTFMRGQDHEKIGVFIDESQNYTEDEFKKVMTRFHDNCHIIAAGHRGQIDLKNPSKSGFVKYLNHFAKLGEEKVRVCPLTINFRGWISRHADAIGRDEE